jgi:predicted anti-sigma-YlaC factor YlaD
MRHDKIKKMVYLYHDGELDEKDKKAVEQHIEECQECRKEFEDMKELEDVMEKVELKQPPKEAWEKYESSVYNRLERNIGWIFLSIGAMILLFFGGYKLVEGIIKDPGFPLILKIGILAALIGIVILIVSLGREQLFSYKKERYKEIKK